MDSGQVGVLEERDEVSLRSFLKGANGRGLETQIGLEVLSNFTNESLERQLPDQKLCRLLVSSNFSESDGTGPVPMRFLDTTRNLGRGLLSGGLGSELLPGGLATGGLSSGLLSSGVSENSGTKMLVK